MLIDPVTEEIRYVGWTVKDPLHRLRCHLASKKRTYVGNWIRKLKNLGLKPRMCVLQRVTKEDGPQAERYWIAYYRSLGCSLTNLTDGGEGVSGHQASEETKSRLRTAWTTERKQKHVQAHAGKSLSESTKEKIRQATLRQFQSSEAREAVSKVHQGKAISAEHRAIVGAATKKRWEEWRAAGGVTSEETRNKISAARKGKPLSAEAKAKISAYQKGRPKSAAHREKMRASAQCRTKT